MPTGAGVVDEIDLKAKPDAVRAVIDSLDSTSDRWRFDLEQVPGGSRLRLHAPVDAGRDASRTMAEVRRTLDLVARELAP